MTCPVHDLMVPRSTDCTCDPPRDVDLERAIVDALARGPRFTYDLMRETHCGYLPKLMDTLRAMQADRTVVRAFDGLEVLDHVWQISAAAERSVATAPRRALGEA